MKSSNKSILKYQFFSLIIIDMSSSSKNNGSGGFFQNLLASLFKSSNPEADKKRKLKNIAKAFSKTKFHMFYKPNTLEVTSAFAKMMYDFYKATSQGQVYFRNTPNPNQSKQRLITYSLSENQAALLEHFDEGKIMEMSKQIPIAKLKAQIEQELLTFKGEFEGERANKIENLYKAFCLFRDFCSYDYYVLLRKFNGALKEFSFEGSPNFDKITGDYIVDNIKDFIDVAFPITDETIVWTDLFEFFQQTTGKELVSQGNWKKIIARVRSIQATRTFDMMIQMISQDPSYVSDYQTNIESLLDPYVDSLTSETLSLVNKISEQQKESKANNICLQIFGTASPQSLSHYVPSFNEGMIKKNLDQILYAEPLNYLKSFLVEYLKRDIREFYDVVVIRGQWDSSLSAPMSNAYQELLTVSDSITAFDDSFAEEGAMGMKIKTLLPKTGHDNSAISIINRVISDANDTAKGFILTSSQNLVTIGKTIKQLIEDYSLSKPVLVQNWKELEKYIEQPMKDFSVGIYKKIYLFVQLMQQYLTQSE